MIELIRETTPRARVRHWCYDCGNRIAKGAHYHAQVLKYDDCVYTIRSHLDCRDATIGYISSGYPPDYGDGLPPLYEMIASGDGQADLDAMRGHYPHVVCRIELGRQLSEIRYEENLAAFSANEVLTCPRPV